MTSCRGDLRVSVPQIMSASFHAMLSEFAMRYSTRVPREVYAGFFPGADTFGETLAYYETYTYLGPGSHDDEIALANKMAGKTPTPFASWARDNFRLGEASPA